MKLILGRIVSIAVMAGGWLLTGIKLVLDLIGYSTAPDDAQVAMGLLERFLAWILSVPWWATLTFVLATTLWLIWVSWPRAHAAPAAAKSTEPIKPPETPRPVSRFVGKKPAVPEKPSPAPEKQWKPTSAYDLPLKLGAIDTILAFLGSEKECELTIRRGVALAKDWERQIKQEGLEVFIDRLKGYQDEIRNLNEKIHEHKKVNEKYKDIEYILTPKEPVNAHKPLNRLLEACKNMRPSPPIGMGFFLVEFAIAFEAALKDFGRWRHETEKALLARRQELSG